jgi:hypothetical protein
MSVILSKCAECKRFSPNRSKLECDIFPDGIPLEVFKSDKDEPCKYGDSFFVEEE